MTNSDILLKLDKVLEGIASQAKKLNIKGVAVAGYYTKESGLISQAKVCGLIANDKYNFLAIAYSKLSEMCLTFKDSGLPGRPILLGELGYAGGAIKPFGEAFYLAAFSGGKSEDDLAASKAGLEIV